MEGSQLHLQRQKSPDDPRNAAAAGHGAVFLLTPPLTLTILALCPALNVVLTSPIPQETAPAVLRLQRAPEMPCSSQPPNPGSHEPSSILHAPVWPGLQVSCFLFSNFPTIQCKQGCTVESPEVLKPSDTWFLFPQFWFNLGVTRASEFSPGLFYTQECNDCLVPNTITSSTRLKCSFLRLLQPAHTLKCRFLKPQIVCFCNLCGWGWENMYFWQAEASDVGIRYIPTLKLLKALLNQGAENEYLILSSEGKLSQSMSWRKLPVEKFICVGPTGLFTCFLN